MAKDLKLILENIHLSPGSTVRGELRVSVDKPKEYDGIYLTLWGAATVRWQVSQDRHTVTFFNREMYVHNQVPVWEAKNSPTGDLPVGEHHFPFSFWLPENVPPSFEGKYGQVRYEVAASITAIGSLTRPSVKSKHLVAAHLIVEDERPRPDILRRYNQPITVVKTKALKFLFFRSGSVSARVDIPRRGFSPGEIIPINVKVNNQSSRQVSVASVLQRVDTFTESRGTQRTVHRLIAETVSSPIRPGVNASYEGRKLVIPVDVQKTLRGCSCISVEYYLIVVVRIPWSFNKKIKIQITIANGGSTPVVGSAVPLSLQHQQAAASHPASLTVTEEQRQDLYYLPSYNDAVGQV